MTTLKSMIGFLARKIEINETTLQNANCALNFDISMKNGHGGIVFALIKYSLFLVNHTNDVEQLQQLNVWIKDAFTQNMIAIRKLDPEKDRDLHEFCTFLDTSNLGMTTLLCLKIQSFQE